MQVVMMSFRHFLHIHFSFYYNIFDNCMCGVESRHAQSVQQRFQKTWLVTLQCNMANFLRYPFDLFKRVGLLLLYVK
jgi:hypothetical protein